MVFCYNECCRRVRRQICSNNGNEKEATTLDMVMQMQLEKDETQHAMNGPAADDAAVLFAELLEEYPYTEPKRGDIRQGTILWVGDDSVLMDVGAKRDAIVQRQDLNRLDESIIAGLEVGAELPVLVLRTAQKDDELIVSIKRGLEDQVWQTAQAAMDDKAVMELSVIGQNKGGLLVDYEGLRGFVPSSHVPALRYLRNDAREERKQELIGTEMPVQVIEVDRRRRRLVMSGRAAARHMRSQRLQELEAGQIVTGVVENITNFGVFVNLNGVTGLVHISRLDWQRVDHPSELFEAGDEITARIDSIDRDRGRISLNRQAVTPSPWEVLPTVHDVGEIIEGTVTNVVDFGIFVRIDVGVEGLVHNSELQPQQADAPFYAPAPGDTVRVRILRIDPDRQRLALSMRDIEPMWQVADEGDADADTEMTATEVTETESEPELGSEPVQPEADAQPETA